MQHNNKMNITIDTRIGHRHESADVDVSKPAQASPLIAITPKPCLQGVAFDHRHKLCDMAKACGEPLWKVSKLKALIFSASRDAARQSQIGSEFAILIDDEFGSEVIAAAQDQDVWVGRPVSVPYACPLRYEMDLNDIQHWPKHHRVKCLLTYHPEDALALKQTQTEKVLRLQKLLQASQHELLLEVILPEGKVQSETTFSKIFEDLYQVGLSPHWWKIPAQSQAAWQAIQGVLNRYDPKAGVLIMGQAMSLPALSAAFIAGASVDCVRGYMVGRTLFAAAAQAWFRGEIDDESCKGQIAANTLALMSVWKSVQDAKTMHQRA